MVRIFLLMAALHSANVALAETGVKGRPALVLDGEAAQVVVDLLGGSIADFHLRDQGVNPLSWGPRKSGGRAAVNGALSEEAAAGAVERTNTDLEMEVDALFIE